MEEQNTVPVVKTSEWILTFLIAGIPVVGLVMLFVWAFGSETNPNKANMAKAMLIWGAIILVLYILFFVAFGAAMFAAMQ